MVLSFFLFVTLILKTEYNVYEKRRIYEKDNYKYNNMCNCYTWYSNTSKLTKVKVAEVAHTIFYAPQYVALEKGYFKDEGLDIDLILTPGADKVTSAVLSKDVDIGFCGSEASIYVYNSDNEDYIVSFAGLTKRDGAFLVSREKIDNFKLDDLKGKYVIGGRKGGMPEMTFEYTLKENNIDWLSYRNFSAHL